MIGCLVVPWDKETGDNPAAVSNIQMGRALLGTIVHPAARSLSMMVQPQDLEKLATTGVIDSVTVYPTMKF